MQPWTIAKNMTTSSKASRTPRPAPKRQILVSLNQRVNVSGGPGPDFRSNKIYLRSPQSWHFTFIRGRDTYSGNFTPQKQSTEHPNHIFQGTGKPIQQLTIGTLQVAEGDTSRSVMSTHRIPDYPVLRERRALAVVGPSCRTVQRQPCAIRQTTDRRR